MTHLRALSVLRRGALCSAAGALALLAAGCAGLGEPIRDTAPVDLAAQTPERVHAAAADYRSNDCDMLARFLPVMQHGHRITAGFQHTVYGWHVSAIEQVLREKGCDDLQAAAATLPAVGGVLDLQLAPVTPALARSQGLDAARGAMIASVDEASAAAQAGLRPRDIILEVAGQPVQTPAELKSIVALMAPGVRAPLRVWREGAMADLSIAVDVQPAPAKALATTARR
jgi:hypothetical protein